MSSFFNVPTLSKGNRGDKAKSRSSARTSGSSAASHNNSASPTDLAQSTPYDRIPARPMPTSGPSYQTTSNGRREDYSPVVVTPPADSDSFYGSGHGQPMMPSSSSSLNVTTSGVPSEFGGTSPGRSASGYQSSLSPRRGSDNASIRSMSSTLSSSMSLQRPNDELGRYPTMTRVVPNSTEVRLPNGSRAMPAPRETTSSLPYTTTTAQQYQQQQQLRQQSLKLQQAAQAQIKSQQHQQHVVPPSQQQQQPLPTPSHPSSSVSNTSGYTTSSNSTPTINARTTSRESNSSGKSGSYAASTYAPSTYASSTYAPSIQHSAAPSTPVYPSSVNSQSTARVTEEFHFPRPSDEEVEQRFFDLVKNRDLDQHHASASTSSPVPSMSSRHSTQTISSAGARATSTLSTNTKWQMVQADARSRWENARERKRKEDEAVRMGRSRQSAAALTRDSPEYFIRKVLDNQLNHQHLVTLGVSLRTLPLE